MPALTDSVSCTLHYTGFLESRLLQAAHVGLHDEISGVASSGSSEADGEDSKDSSHSSATPKPNRRGGARGSSQKRTGQPRLVPPEVAMELVGLTVAVPTRVFGEPSTGRCRTCNRNLSEKGEGVSIFEPKFAPLSLCPLHACRRCFASILLSRPPARISTLRPTRASASFPSARCTPVLRRAVVVRHSPTIH